MRDNYFIVGARGTVIALQLVSIKLLTVYLDAENIGLYFFLISASYFSNSLLFIPVDYYQQAFISKAADKINAVKTALIFNRQVAYFYFSVVILASLFLSFSSFKQYLLLFGLAAFGSIALHIMQSMRNLLNNLGFSITVSMSQILEAFTRVSIFWGACLLDFANLEMIAVAWASSLGLASAHLIFVGMKVGVFSGHSVNSIELKDFLKFSTPISFSAVTNWLQVQGYRVALVPLGYAEAVGIFSTISNIGSSAIGAVNLIYQQKFNPRIYQSQGAYTQQYLRYAAILIGATIGLFALLGQPIVKLLTTATFHDYWYVILYGVAADSANLIIGALTIYLTIKKTTNVILLFSAAGFVVNASIFIALYASDTIEASSIGIPILLSQWAVAGLLFYQFKTKVTS